MVDFKIRIIVDPTQGRRNIRGVEQDLGRVEAKAEGVGRTFKRIFTITAAALAAREVGQLADAFTSIQNRIRVVTSGQAELTNTTEALFQVSQRTRSSFESTVTVYNRLALSANELGISLEEATRLTESLNQAVIIGGSSSQEASAGLIQLSQGLASGALRGDELRSVLEQLPVVADVIAKSLGVTRGELRLLGQDGKITADIIIEAFREAEGELTERFAKTVPTIGQSFEQLRNSAIEFTGEFQGGIDAVAGGVGFLAKNFDTLAKGAISLGVAVTGIKLASYGKAAENAIRSTVQLTAAVAAGNNQFSRAAEATRALAITKRNERIASVASARADIVAAQAAANRTRVTIASVQAERTKIAATAQGNLATFAAIAADRQLAALRGQLAIQTEGVAAAQAHMTAATAVAATAQGRLVASQKAVVATSGLMSGALLRAGVAVRGLGLAIAANPIGAVITVLTLAATAFIAFGDDADDATDALKEQEKALDRETQALKLSAKEREKSNRILQVEEQLRRKLTKAERESLFAKVDLARSAKEESKRREQAQKDLKDTTREVTELQERIAGLEEEGERLQLAAFTDLSQGFEESARAAAQIGEKLEVAKDRLADLVPSAEQLTRQQNEQISLLSLSNRERAIALALTEAIKREGKELSDPAQIQLIQDQAGAIFDLSQKQKQSGETLAGLVREQTKENAVLREGIELRVTEASILDAATRLKGVSVLRANEALGALVSENQVLREEIDILERTTGAFADYEARVLAVQRAVEAGAVSEAQAAALRKEAAADLPTFDARIAQLQELNEAERRSIGILAQSSLASEKQAAANEAVAEAREDLLRVQVGTQAQAEARLRAAAEENVVLELLADAIGSVTVPLQEFKDLQEATTSVIEANTVAGAKARIALAEAESKVITAAKVQADLNEELERSRGHISDVESRLDAYDAQIRKTTGSIVGFKDGERNAARAAIELDDALKATNPSLEQLQLLLREGEISADQFRIAFIQLRKEGLQASNDLESGLRAGLLGVAQDYEQVGAAAERFVSGQAAGTESLIVDSIRHQGEMRKAQKELQEAFDKGNISLEEYRLSMRSLGEDGRPVLKFLEQLAEALQRLTIRVLAEPISKALTQQLAQAQSLLNGTTSQAGGQAAGQAAGAAAGAAQAAVGGGGAVAAEAAIAGLATSAAGAVAPVTGLGVASTNSALSISTSASIVAGQLGRVTAAGIAAAGALSAVASQAAASAGTTVVAEGVKASFASGGQARAGELALVGEKGPELFVPSRSGSVVSNDQTSQILQQMAQNQAAPRQATPVNVNVINVRDEDEIGNVIESGKVDAQLINMMKRKSSSLRSLL